MNKDYFTYVRGKKKIIIAFLHEISVELDFEAPCGS